MVRKKKKAAKVINTAEGRSPARMKENPPRSVNPRTPLIRRRGPPHAAITRPPMSIPLPPIDKTVPSTEGVLNDKTRGVVRTKMKPLRKFVAAKKKSNASSPGRDVMYLHP